MIGLVDIGGTKVAVGGARLEESLGILHARREMPTEPALGFDAMVTRIVAMLKDLGGGSPLEGVAIGSTGPIDRATGVYGRVDTLPGFEGHNLSDSLRTALRNNELPIVIENDADAAALGEYATAGIDGAKRFLFVTVSTGIGGGLIVDGEVYRGGLNGSHPEIGHHMIDGVTGPTCSCGARGCWEALASGPAMAAMAANGKNAEQICASARQGEAWAVEIVDREALYLGIGIANLVSVLVPDVIALGGGVMKSADLFLDRIRETVRTRCTLIPAVENVKIVRATMGLDAGLIGAAQAFRNRYAASRAPSP